MTKTKTSIAVNPDLLKLVDKICYASKIKRNTFIEKSIKLGVKSFIEEFQHGLSKR